jgi:hypothetical protein
MVWMMAARWPVEIRLAWEVKLRETQTIKLLACVWAHTWRLISCLLIHQTQTS